MKRIILAVPVGVLVSGPVGTDEDADGVLLTCSGKYNQGGSAPMTTNFIIARDGSWIRFSVSKLKGASSKGGRWFYEGKSSKESILTMEITFD